MEINGFSQTRPANLAQRPTEDREGQEAREVAEQQNSAATSRAQGVEQVGRTEQVSTDQTVNQAGQSQELDNQGRQGVDVKA